LSGALDRARGVRHRIEVEGLDVLALERPLLNTLGRAFRDRPMHRSLLVRLEDAEGLIGWGETPVIDLPAYAANGFAPSWHALTELLAPRVTGRRFEGPTAFAAAYSEVQGFAYAKHGLESAAWSVVSQKAGQSLAALWGGERRRVPVGESVGIQRSLAELLAEVEDRLAEGYVRIKLKIGPGWDLEPLREVRRRFPDLALTADGNCHYADPDDGPFVEIDELGLQMIEQPLPADALAESAELQAKLRTAVCLDESATSRDLTAAALRLGAGRVVNVKPGRLGGLWSSLDVHDLCQSLGVPVWCGGMLESGIGRGFNLALCSLPGFSLPADMSPARVFFGEDLVEPTYELEADGHMAVPDGLGCGFPVVEERVRRYTVATWSGRSLTSRSWR
jgi:o-succinylbenzoate synthase